MSELDNLRNLVRKRRAAVSNKVARNRRINGVQITGSEFDPRRAPEVVKRYNTPQLQRYLAQLDAFMSRRVQFSSGDNGAPLPRNEARAYQAKVSRFQSAGEARIQAMSEIEIKPLGKTVGVFRQGRAMKVPNAVVNSPYGSTIKDVRGIPSADSLRKLSKDLDDKLNTEYLPGKIREGRESLVKALTIMGETDFIKSVNELSEYQFEVLWFGTSFADTAFMKYDIEQERAAGTRKERWQDRVIENDYKLISEFLEWASNDLPRENPNQA